MQPIGPSSKVELVCRGNDLAECEKDRRERVLGAARKQELVVERNIRHAQSRLAGQFRALTQLLEVRHRPADQGFE